MKFVNRYPRTVTFAIILVFLTWVIVAFTVGFTAKAEQFHHGDEEKKAVEVNAPVTVTVILERVYLDGEVSEEIKEITIWSMEDFWAEHSSWQLIDQDEEQIVFQKNIDDISPLLKANGYFGITDEGVLTIFNGRPETENVIQSFFQIDVKKLESHQHEELKNGIPISSKDKYVEVLEVFKTLSISP